MSDSTPKPWGGRFVERTDVFVERFTASVFFDQRLAKYDIEGSKAHAYMLQECNILSKKEYLSIVDGLVQIEQEIESGTFEWSVELEDVHMNIEARLVQLIGDTGKKLHTGRSRNDQVFHRSQIVAESRNRRLRLMKSTTCWSLLLEKAESARRDDHAWIDSSAKRSTSNFGASLAGMVRDAHARQRTPLRLPQA